MLARASSDAGTRLRHAKSTSSVQSRGKRAVAEPSDPFVIREHATAAAVQAFELAYALDHTKSSAERSLELARRRSTASRGSQGSHFPPRGSSLRQAGEDSAIRHRKSAQSHRISIERQQSSSPHTAAAPVVTPQHHLRTHMPTSSIASAPSRPKNTVSTTSPAIAPSTPASKQIRKSRSMYTSWSLGFGNSRDAHHDTNADSRCSTSQVFKENKAPSVGGSSARNNTASQRTFEASSAEEVSAARDKILQDFQTNMLRKRPSFAFTPFKKRSEEQQKHPSSAVLDPSSSPHSTPPLGIPAPAVTPAKLEEKRSLSGSLKNRFKKVFRKTSKPTISLPVQQVDASRAYFGNSITTTPGEASPYGATATSAEYSTSNDVPRSSSRQRVSSDISNHSRNSVDDHEPSDISKSRVTSWTNSSVANSLNNRDPKRLSMIPEFEPTSEKKRNTSILGRSPFKKPPHTSHHGVTNRPDSFDVFSTLKSRLEKAGLDSNLHPDLPNPGPNTLHDKTERAMLPSQTRHSSNTSKLSRATRATIRTVTPEVFGRSRSKDRTGEDRQEVDEDDDLGRQSPDNDDDSGLILPRIRLQRAAKATVPTPEQVATRKKKTENRWQTQLGQGHSPVFSKNVKKAMAGDNPYQLTPLDQYPSPSKSIEAPPRTSSRKPQEPVDMLSPNWPSRADIMSPSIYSRDSSGESPIRKESDGSNCPPGTVVIVSSHSAKSYALGSSPKKDTNMRSARNSRDWKTWLSKEVSELDLSQDFDMSMTEEWLLKPAGHQREHAEIVGVTDDEDEIVIFKSRPASSNFPNRPERLTLVDPPTRTAEGSTVSRPDQAKLGSATSTPSDEGSAIDSGREVSGRSQKSSESQKSGRTDEKRGIEHIKASGDGNKITQRSSDGAKKAPVSAPAQSPESEKILVNTLTDRTVRHSKSYHSINRSIGRSHSSLAHYTTSAEDPDMLQQTPTLLRATPSLPYVAPVTNPPFRFRPADPSSTATARTSPVSRPRSAFDLRNQYSSAGLRSAAATAAPAIPSPSGSPAATPAAAGPTLLPPPPHHPHHLRRKPVTVGVRRGRLTPSPTPTASLEGDTMQMIMQGPYGTNDERGTPESSASTPPWVPPPPSASSSRFQSSPLASARHNRNTGGVAGQPLLATRQSTPALRVTPRPGLGLGQQASSGTKENAAPVGSASTTKSFGAGGGNGEVGESPHSVGEREAGTPSPGQLLAQRWLCARQQRGGGGGAAEGAAGGEATRGASGSPAFL